MSYQIIQCPTDISDRRDGIYGTTWIVRSTDHSKYVSVKHSVCSPADQFSRKKGVFRAMLTPSVLVHKAALLNHVNSLNKRKYVYLVPDVYQIYQAIARL